MKRKKNKEGSSLPKAISLIIAIREMAKNKTPQLKTPQICKLCSVPKTPQIPSFRQKFVRTVKFTSSWGFSAIVRNIILAVLGKTYP